MTDLKDLTPEEMARVKALDAAATPGPWGSHVAYDVTGYPMYPIHGMSGDAKHDEPRLQVNADVIAEYRSLLPRAAAQIERLQAEHAKLTAQRCETCRHHSGDGAC